MKKVQQIVLLTAILSNAQVMNSTRFDKGMNSEQIVNVILVFNFLVLL